MPTVEAKKIVLQYAEKLRAAQFPFDALYLFGSYAKGEQRENSDIDVAVISPILRDTIRDEEFTLWRLRRAVDSRIDPHGFTPEDFANDVDPMVYEIKQTGVQMA